MLKRLNVVLSGCVGESALDSDRIKSLIRSDKRWNACCPYLAIFLSAAASNDPDVAAR